MATSLCPLPLECLSIILQILLDNNEHRTLARCLLVNSFFRDAALPLLYQAPFQASKFFIEKCHFRIVQLLLRQLPRDKVSELLSVAYDLAASAPGNDNDNNLNRTTIDYLSLVRVFDLESVIFKPWHMRTLREVLQRYPSRLIDYVFTSKPNENEIQTEAETLDTQSDAETMTTMNENETMPNAGGDYGEGLHDQELWFPQWFTSPSTTSPWIRFPALEATLRRELTWTLCSPVLEQIQSLKIPLSDINRYLDQVERFQSLTSVAFLMDDYCPRFDDYPSQELLHNEEETLREQCRTRIQGQFHSMIVFVQRHCSLFRNRLLYATCLNDARGSWFQEAMRCPQTIQQELFLALPPPFKPKMINQENWSQIASKIKEVDLGSVEHLRLNRSDFLGTDFKSMADLLSYDPSFLSRCRRLSDFSTWTTGHGSFLWAVKEKRAWDRLRVSNTVTGQGNRSTVIPSPLVPLQSVNITSLGSIQDELDDLAFAFQDTLEHLTALMHMPSVVVGDEVGGGPADINSVLHIGRDWRLPKLGTLDIQVKGHRNICLVLDRELMSTILNKDQLEKLRISDGFLGPYRSQDIPSCEPVLGEMPRLTNVVLEGRSALTFHPGNFYQTPNLKTLHVGLRIDFNHPECFIPPQEELEAWCQQEQQGHQHGQSSENNTTQYFQCRLPWTWDWYLPHLERLVLNCEFAFLFQFRMLGGCPSLQSLSLDITTLVTGVTAGASGHRHVHERVLSVEDFTLPSSSPSLTPLAASLNSITSSTWCPSFFISGKKPRQLKKPVLMAPKLRTLTLRGRWILPDDNDDDILKLMFWTVFPCLEVLDEYQTSDYSLQSWIDTLQRLPRLIRVHCGLLRPRMSNDEEQQQPQQGFGVSYMDQRITAELKELGLVPADNSPLDSPRFQIYGEDWTLSSDVERRKVERRKDVRFYDADGCLDDQCDE